MGDGCNYSLHPIVSLLHTRPPPWEKIISSVVVMMKRGDFVTEVLSLLIFQLLSEIRPYLVGTGGGVLELVQISNYVVKVRLSGPAATVMTVRVAVTQKLREKISSIAAVQLID